MTFRPCPDCRTERLFEQPPCPDGHADCPEWVCTVCGCALVDGWLAVDAPGAAEPAPAARRRGAAA
jgi:hypothetical protein